MPAGDPVYASTVAISKDSSVTTGTTTSTSFVNSLTTTGIRGVAFTAPATGKVRVMGGCGGYNSTANQYTLVDFEIRAGSTVGSGTVVRAADNNTASQFNSAVASAGGQHSILDVVTGLTPGDVYNACLTYEVTGSTTGNFNRRKIIVESIT